MANRKIERSIEKYTNSKILYREKCHNKRIKNGKDWIECLYRVYTSKNKVYIVFPRIKIKGEKRNSSSGFKQAVDFVADSKTSIQNFKNEANKFLNRKKYDRKNNRKNNNEK